MINRGAVLLRYKGPAVRWVNESDPHDDAPGLTLERANEERTVYLVHDEVADSPEAVRAWVEANFLALLENELEGWYVDDSLWPQERTMELFDDWFEVECHSMVVDTIDEPIIDEVYEIDRN